MGSYEVIVKTEELRRKVQEGDYLSAQKILDTIDLKKVKNLSDLSLMAEVFQQNERYDDAMGLLQKIYNKSKTRKLLYQMVWTSISRRNAEEAEELLNEYEKLAPEDFYKHIFRYNIDKIKGESYDILIGSLKALKETEYIEQWAYELAKLYYKAGMEKECIRECSDIILWFGEGSYVEKAKILKAYYSGETDKEKIIEDLKKRALQSPNEEENASEEETYEVRTAEEKEIISEDNEQKPEDADQDNEVEEAAVEIASDESPAIPMDESLSARELAEQEVEDELYRLLDEEGEESRRLDELSDELEMNLSGIFGDFLQDKNIRKQMVRCLENILDKHTKSVQIFITGTPGSGKTTLAKDISVFLYKIGKLKSARVAKISAENLNSIDIMTKKDTLKDCCIVIENAGNLKRPTIDKLLELIHYFHGEAAVILEDNKKNMNRLFEEYPKLMDLFKNRIHLRP